MAETKTGIRTILLQEMGFPDGRNEDGLPQADQ